MITPVHSGIYEPEISDAGVAAGFFGSLLSIIGYGVILRLLHPAIRNMEGKSPITVPASQLQNHISPESASMVQSILKKAGLPANQYFALSENGWLSAGFKTINIGLDIWNSLTLSEQEIALAHECIHIRDHHALKSLALAYLSPFFIKAGLHLYDKLSFKAFRWMKQQYPFTDKWYLLMDALQKMNHYICSSPITNVLLSLGLFVAHSRHLERQADIKAVIDLGADPRFGINWGSNRPAMYRMSDFSQRIYDLIGLHPSKAERTQYFIALAENKNV